MPWNKRSRTQDTGLRAWRTPHTGRAVEPEGGHMAGSPRERAEKGGVVYKEFTNDNTADRESDSCPPAPRVDGSDGVRGVMLGRTRWTPRPATGAVGAGRAGVGRAPRRAPGRRALGPVISRSAAGSVEGRPGKASGVCDVCDRRVSQRRPLRRGRKQTFFSTSGNGQLDTRTEETSVSAPRRMR